MIDEKYRRKKLFKVGQVVKIRRDLVEFSNPLNEREGELEKAFDSYKRGSKYFEALFIGVNNEMVSMAGAISIVKSSLVNYSGFDYVTLEDDRKWKWTYDMFEPYFEPVVIYETISGIKLQLSECGSFLIGGKTKINVSDYDLFLEHKNIKSLSII